MKIQTKPVQLEAVAVSAIIDLKLSDWESWQNVPTWIREAMERGDLLRSGSGMSVFVDGEYRFVRRTSYLLRYANGDLYSCTAEEFTRDYVIIEV